MPGQRAEAAVHGSAGAGTGPLRGPRRTPRAVRVVHAAAGTLAVSAFAWTLWHGLHQPAAALAFGVLVAIGELSRWGPGAMGPSRSDDREVAPLGAAGAFAYALLGHVDGHPTTHGVAQVVTVVAAAVLVGATPHVAAGRSPGLDRLARRVITTAFAAVCFQPLYNSGWFGTWAAGGPYYPAFVLLLLVLSVAADAVLCATLARARTGWPYGPLLRDHLRGLVGIGSAVCATGAVIALAVAAAGLWALPVFCVPLLLTQYSFRRYAAIRATYRQTIASLARATEIAGYTPAGHARRVAALSRAVGRELGLSESELTVLEYAALMHDIGQLSLVDPVPEGATESLPQDEQRRIALLGGAVVRQTGVPAEVAVVVERQADPYREQPQAARIIRAVNAYEDLTGRERRPEGTLSVLEHLRLSTARDYEPRVVEALAQVVARGGDLLRTHE